MDRNIWQCFTNPKSIAVVGASEQAGSVGNTVMLNLLAGQFAGALSVVSATSATVHGHEAYRSIGALPEPVDLAVIAAPVASVPGLIRQCGQAGVRVAVVLSTGFNERGTDEHSLATEIKKAAVQGEVRVVGPDSAGVIVPHLGLNASFVTSPPKRGNLAFLSQSSELGTAILSWSVKKEIGLSAFVSFGAMDDIGWGETIDYLADDPETHSLVISMEMIGNAREFMSAAREFALYKPIVVLKSSARSSAEKSVASHAGSVVENDEVLDAAFDRCGIFRVKTITELFYLAEALAKQPRPRGPRMTIVTNARGPALLAANALVDEGGRLASPCRETIDALDKIMPPGWSRHNPIEVSDDPSGVIYSQAVRHALADPHTDSVLMVLSPPAEAGADPGRSPDADELREVMPLDVVQVAEEIAALPNKDAKPLLAGWLAGDHGADGKEILQRASIPCLPYPDTAARIIQHMWRYGESLRNLYETPHRLDDGEFVPDVAHAAEIIDMAGSCGRGTLTEYESKEVLHAHGIPTVETRLARTVDDAVAAARRIGFPVAIKLNSDVIMHKSRMGGVYLDIDSEAGVRRAFDQIRDSVIMTAGPAAFQGVTVQPMLRRNGYEVMLRSKIDPQFGPILYFGSGGRFTDAIRDYATALPPLNTTLARRLLGKTRAYSVIKEFTRQTPLLELDLDRVLVKFSNMILDHGAISEFEINPLVVSDEGIIALDAHVTVFPNGASEVPSAIAPYPAHYVRRWKTRQGKSVTIRPIRPEDEPAMVRFHKRLSDKSVLNRYLSIIDLAHRTAHERLTKLCFVDYDRQIAFVAEFKDRDTGLPEIAAVGRIVRRRGPSAALLLGSKAGLPTGATDQGDRTSTADFGILVSDDWQGEGLGEELLSRILEYARDMRVERVTADILADNYAMQHIAEKLGFVLAYDEGVGIVTAVWTAGRDGP